MPTFLSLLALILISVLVPNHVLLVILVIPLIILSDHLGIVPPIFSLGGADVRIYDLVILVVAMKVIVSIFTHKQRLYKHPIYLPIFIFIGVLLGTTLFAYFRFGQEIFIGELVALLRFLVQISVLFLLILSIKSLDQINCIAKWIDYLGYVIAGSIYFNLILFSAGFKFGEVQSTAYIVRYFGPVGDQVGFILLFFIFRKLVERNVFGSIFFGGALIATGTRGALIALVVGLIVMVVHVSKVRLKLSRVLSVLLVFIVLIGSIFFYDIGGMRSRFLEASLLEGGLMQRLLTAKLAVEVFSDNPIFGVGYTGFRYFGQNYGAHWLFHSELGAFTSVYIATAGNQYLQIATDGGILALAAFLYMIVVLLKTLKSVSENTTGILKCFFAAGYVWMISLLIGNQTASWLLPGSLISYFLWIILGLALAASIFESSR